MLYYSVEIYFYGKYAAFSMSFLRLNSAHNFSKTLKHRLPKGSSFLTIDDFSSSRRPRDPTLHTNHGENSSWTHRPLLVNFCPLTRSFRALLKLYAWFNYKRRKLAETTNIYVYMHCLHQNAYIFLNTKEIRLRSSYL